MSPSNEFVSMVGIISPGNIGNVKVDYYTVSKQESSFSRMRSAIKANRDLEVDPGDYVRLVNGDVVVMSDTRMERSSNGRFLWRAHGHVLVAGLGIGLILVPALKNSAVESVHVIEKHASVIQLVEPSLRKYLSKKYNKKLTVTEADIFERTFLNGNHRGARSGI